jgi:hypothetical protein
MTINNPKRNTIYEHPFHLIRLPFLTYNRYFRDEVHIDRLPLGKMVERPKTWVAPKSYVTKTEYISEISDLDIKGPYNYKEYLELKFGDWRTPTDEWNYWRDDGMIKDQTPLEFLNESC